MFTGIIQDVGRIQQREVRGGDMRLTIAVDRLNLARVAVGDSICVQGVCLTVAALTDRSFSADVSRERRCRSRHWVNLSTWRQSISNPRSGRATRSVGTSYPATSMGSPR